MLVKPYCFPAIPVEVVIPTFLFLCATNSTLICWAKYVLPVPACGDMEKFFMIYSMNMKDIYHYFTIT